MEGGKQTEHGKLRGIEVIKVVCNMRVRCGCGKIYNLDYTDDPMLCPCGMWLYIHLALHGGLEKDRLYEP